LINAHTHLGDSFAKEAVLGLGVEKAVGPKGKKWELYDKVNDKKIIKGMKDSAKYMLNSGITTFVDFREQGVKGVNLIKKSLQEEDLPIQAIILGRSLNNLEICDGLGLNVHELGQIPNEIKRREKLIAIHAGELEGEIKEALKFNPDMLIHCTKITREEIEEIAKKNISIVVCPRSNFVLRVGIPPVREILNAGINLCLGTDNVMINSPNLWREAEFLSKLSYLQEEKKPLKPKEILRMITVNGAKMLNLNSGVIEKEKKADLIFLDKEARNLRFNENLIATLVHRCEVENVRKVMINGKFVLDKDKDKDKKMK
jgi:cytosine/adenosine deaminase-related metal-dependent hydrolase